MTGVAVAESGVLSQFATSCMPDQVRLGPQDLVREALGPGREVVGDDLAEDLAVGCCELIRCFRCDGRVEDGTEVEVAGHHVDLRAPVVAVAMIVAVAVIVPVAVVMALSGVAVTVVMALAVVVVSVPSGEGCRGQQYRQGQGCGDSQQRRGPSRCVNFAQVSSSSATRSGRLR